MALLLRFGLCADAMPPSAAPRQPGLMPAIAPQPAICVPEASDQPRALPHEVVLLSRGRQVCRCAVQALHHHLKNCCRRPGENVFLNLALPAPPCLPCPHPPAPTDNLHLLLGKQPSCLLDACLGCVREPSRLRPQVEDVVPAVRAKVAGIAVRVLQGRLPFACPLSLLTISQSRRLLSQATCMGVRLNVS